MNFMFRKNGKVSNVLLARHTLDVCFGADLSAVDVELVDFFGFLSPFCAFFADSCMSSCNGLRTILSDPRHCSVLSERVKNDTSDSRIEDFNEDGNEHENASVLVANWSTLTRRANERARSIFDLGLPLPPAAHRRAAAVTRFAANSSESDSDSRGVYTPHFK